MTEIPSTVAPAAERNYFVFRKRAFVLFEFKFMPIIFMYQSFSTVWSKIILILPIFRKLTMNYRICRKKLIIVETANALLFISEIAPTLSVLYFVYQTINWCIIFEASNPI